MRLRIWLPLLLALLIGVTPLARRAEAGFQGGLCAVADHFVGIPYATGSAYWTGQVWSYDERDDHWTTPNVNGSHSRCSHDWGNYFRLVVSIYWNFPQSTYFYDAYAYSDGVVGYP